MASDVTDGIEEEDGPPPKFWWLTGFGRSLHSFEFLSDPKNGGDFFGHLDTISAYALQRKDLLKRMDTYLVLSFLGAALIIAGGLPKDGEISLFGIQGPSRLVSVQLLAALVTGFFTRFMQMLSSLTLLNSMIEKIMTQHVPEGPEFVLARYDATFLWMNLLRKRSVGYQSPLPHTVVNVLFSAAGLMWLLLFIAIVLTSLFLALQEASQPNGTWFPFLIAIVAMAIAVVTVLHFLVSFVIPLPYRMSAGMKEFLQKERLAKAKGPVA